MTSIVGEAEVLKIDERGRVRVPVERREALLDEFEKSGMSGAKFARLAGIKYPTFANWTQAREKAKDREMPGSEPLRLIEPVMEGSGSASGGLVIELSGGGRGRVYSPLQLRVAAELRKRPPGHILTGGVVELRRLRMDNAYDIYAAA